MTNLASAPAYGRPGVLLTGATGFLGGYLLKELVERTEMPIYCLTRSDGTLGARARLMDNLHFLFGADAVEAWPLERIAIVEGDLAKERFGLSEAGYAELAERTGAVFHAAAMLWHFGKLEQFLKVNVQGTENLLAGGERAALRQPKEPVHGSGLPRKHGMPQRVRRNQIRGGKAPASRHARRARCADFPSGLYYGRFEDGPLQEAHHVRRPVSAPSGAHIHAHGPAAV